MEIKYSDNNNNDIIEVTVFDENNNMVDVVFIPIVATNEGDNIVTWITAQRYGNTEIHNSVFLANLFKEDLINQPEKEIFKINKDQVTKKLENLKQEDFVKLVDYDYNETKVEVLYSHYVNYTVTHFFTESNYGIVYNPVKLEFIKLKLDNLLEFAKNNYRLLDLIENDSNFANWSVEYINQQHSAVEFSFIVYINDLAVIYFDRLFDNETGN